MRIPKIIHRIWTYDPSPQDDPMPKEFAAYGRAWKRLHPDWSVVDHTDLSGLEPLRSRAVYDAASGRDFRRYRACILQLEILWKFGGVYVDTDVEPLKPLDPLLADVDAFVGRSPNPGPTGVKPVTNAMMGAVPGHPFVDACIRRLPQSARDFAGKHTTFSVGPWHLQRTIDAGEGHGVTIFEPRVFFPQTIVDRDRGEKADLSQSYAWHKWANSRRRRHAPVEPGFWGWLTRRKERRRGHGGPRDLSVDS